MSDRWEPGISEFMLDAHFSGATRYDPVPEGSLRLEESKSSTPEKALTVFPDDLDNEGDSVGLDFGQSFDKY